MSKSSFFSENDAQRLHNEYLDRIAHLESERDHWKANHDNMVEKCAFLSQRPDLPVDRIPAYDALYLRIAILKQQLATQKTLSHELFESCMVNGYVDSIGCKLVPLEPTEAMIHAAEDLPAPRHYGQVYRAMIKAAKGGAQ